MTKITQCKLIVVPNELFLMNRALAVSKVIPCQSKYVIMHVEIWDAQPTVILECKSYSMFQYCNCLVIE